MVGELTEASQIEARGRSQEMFWWGHRW